MTIEWRLGGGRRARVAAVVSLALIGLLPSPVAANGIFRNGIGARAMALGGADVAWAEDALGAMASNPAGLGFLTGTRLDLSLTGLTGDGEFTNRANTDGRLADVYGVIPDGAVSTRLGPWPVTVGLSATPTSTASSGRAR
jgi:hypothetical protein